MSRDDWAVAKDQRAHDMARLVVAGYSLRHIGRTYGVSHERVRQIVVGAAGGRAGWPKGFDPSLRACAQAVANAMNAPGPKKLIISMS